MRTHRARLARARHASSVSTVQATLDTSPMHALLAVDGPIRRVGTSDAMAAPDAQARPAATPSAATLGALIRMAARQFLQRLACLGEDGIPVSRG
ncbi:MAG: hypothetical protein ACK559_41630, partial [bacterium]